VGRFDGAAQLVVEVEDERGQEVELAEAIHEFDRPCPARAAGGSRSGRVGLFVAGVVAAAILAAGLVARGRALRVLRHPGGG
jgi:hypothetical protein